MSATALTAFDADDNRTTKTPCLPLARFFEKIRVRVRLWKKQSRIFIFISLMPPEFFTKQERKFWIRFLTMNFPLCTVFVCAFVENRMKDAQSLDPILFDCLFKS